MVATAAAGVAFIALAFVANSDSRWASIRIEVGAGFLLVGAIFLIEERLRRSTEAYVRDEVAGVDERVSELAEGLDEVRSSLLDGDAITSEIRAKRANAIDDLLGEFARTGDFKPMYELFYRANQLGTVQRKESVHIAIPTKPGTLAFSFAQNDRCHIQLTQGGTGTTTITHTEWHRGSPVADIVAKLEELVLKSNQWPGEAHFDASAILMELAEEYADRIQRHVEGPS